MSSKGKKRLVIGYLEILTGGRGNTLKKAIGIKVEQTCTNEINQSQWSSFARTCLEGIIALLEFINRNLISKQLLDYF